MRRLLWGRTALRDLDRIVDEYEAIDPRLGRRLLARILDVPLVLLEHPALGSPTRRRGIRKWNARATPFMLFYAITGDDIEIRRVRHNRSDVER